MTGSRDLVTSLTRKDRNAKDDDMPMDRIALMTGGRMIGSAWQLTIVRRPGPGGTFPPGPGRGQALRK